MEINKENKPPNLHSVNCCNNCKYLTFVYKVFFAEGNYYPMCSKYDDAVCLSFICDSYEDKDK